MLGYAFNFIADNELFYIAIIEEYVAILFVAVITVGAAIRCIEIHRLKAFAFAESVSPDIRYLFGDCNGGEIREVARFVAVEKVVGNLRYIFAELDGGDTV